MRQILIADDVDQIIKNEYGSILEPAFQHLWEAACASPGDPERGSLSPSQDRKWFIHAFCTPRESIGYQAGVGSMGRDDRIWPWVLHDIPDLCHQIAELINLMTETPENPK